MSNDLQAARRAVIEPFDRRHGFALLAVTLIAAVLRLWQVGEWSLWVDEAHTWRDATMQLAGEHGYLQTQRVLYPVTSMLLRLLMGLGILGFGEGSLRLPFVCFGIVTVPMMALCGRRLVGAWPAVVAAALLAINPWHIFWSQNARGYVLVILAAVIAVNRGHAWLCTERNRDLFAAAAALGVGTMSHPTAAFLAVGFVGFLIVRRAFRGGSGYRRLWWGCAVLLLVLVVLPWLIKHYSPFQNFLRAKGDPSLAHFVQTSLYYFRPTVLLLAALSLVWSPRVLGRERALLLACMVALPVPLLTAVSAQLVKATARYAISVLPVLTWLVGFGCVQAARLFAEGTQQPRWARLALAGVLPLLVVGEYLRLDQAYFTAQHGQRARWREAARFVQTSAGDRGLRVLTVNEPTLLYYLRRRHWFVTEDDPRDEVDVVPLIGWMFAAGVDQNKVPVHEPGAENHLAWHRAEADRRQALFAIMVTLPELQEQDRGGELRRVMARDFELALHLPCWVGPKDESVYVYLPKP